MDKKWGLRIWKAFNFKKWRGLEPRSLTEVYAYVWGEKCKIRPVSIY